MKFNIKLLLIFVLCFCFFLTGCGSFFGEEESLVMEKLETKTLENGDIEITIYYSNEDVKPTTFVVPKGDDGATGNGIKSFDTFKSEDGKSTICHIEFTYNTPSVEFAIPNGVSIEKIETEKNEETEDTYMTVVYSDGSKSDPIIVPKGEKGDPGISITGITQKINRDYSVTLTLTMSEGDPVKVEIPAPIQGEDGRGIAEIVSVPNGDKYVMTIKFTDETEQELEFARPNRWFSESAGPKLEDGINGDLWYDLAHQIIYVKQNNKWNMVMNFNNVVDLTYEVKFDLNDTSAEPASMPAGTLISYQIECGTYFAASGYPIPVPTRTGYLFKGWYTVKIPSVVNGAFTDLTPVQSDLTLYAVWEKA